MNSFSWTLPDSITAPSDNSTRHHDPRHSWDRIGADKAPISKTLGSAYCQNQSSEYGELLEPKPSTFTNCVLMVSSDSSRWESGTLSSTDCSIINFNCWISAPSSEILCSRRDASDNTVGIAEIFRFGDNTSATLFCGATCGSVMPTQTTAPPIRAPTSAGMTMGL